MTREMGMDPALFKPWPGQALRIPVPGTNLAAWSSGPADGLPVVFIHGLAFDHRMWLPQLAALPERTRAIGWDLRGHGQTDPGDGQYSLELFVDDLVALLDHLELHRAVLCGLSMGGYIALRAAEREPDRVHALVLCDTRSAADSNEQKLRRAAQVRLVKAGRFAAFAAPFIDSVLCAHTLAHRPAVVAQLRSMVAGVSPSGLCGTLLALAARTDTTAALATLCVPVLVAVGEHDTVTPPAESARLQAAIPGATLLQVPQAGHVCTLENPGDFNPALAAFLAPLARAWPPAAG
jgi:3-oxoadipate enol-lactonase